MNTEILPGDILLGSTTSEANTMEYALTDIRNASLPIKGCAAVTNATSDSGQSPLQYALDGLIPTGLKSMLRPDYESLGLGMILVVDQKFMRAITTVLEVSGEQVYELGFLLKE